MDVEVEVEVEMNDQCRMTVVEGTHQSPLRVCYYKVPVYLTKTNE